MGASYTHRDRLNLNKQYSEIEWLTAVSRLFESGIILSKILKNIL